MPLKELNKLLLVADPAVMLFLFVDVIPDGIDICETDGKCAVSPLPLELFQHRIAKPFRLILHPGGRIGLQRFNQFGQGHAFGKDEQGMDVVMSSTDLDWNGLQLTADAAKIGMEIIKRRRRQ